MKVRRKPIRGPEKGTQRREEDGEARGMLGKSGTVRYMRPRVCD